jgi:hypothetical protein
MKTPIRETIEAIVVGIVLAIVAAALLGLIDLIIPREWIGSII